MLEKQQNWLTGFAPKLNILISFEMSSLKLGSFALSLTLNFHICTHLPLKTKPGCANCPTPHPPQFRWFVPSSMKLMWTENNDFVRALVLLLFYISLSHIKYWSCFYHISNNNNNNWYILCAKYCSKTGFNNLFNLSNNPLEISTISILLMGQPNLRDSLGFTSC